MSVIIGVFLLLIKSMVVLQHSSIFNLFLTQLSKTYLSLKQKKLIQPMLVFYTRGITKIRMKL